MMTKSLMPRVVCEFLFTAILAMLVFPLGAFAAGVLENRNLVPLVVDPIPNYNSVLSAVPLDRFDRIEALTSTFTINYLPAGAGSYGDTCTTWPVAAQTAFESAVNIWASRLVSAVPITIDACWATNLSAGVLGHSGSLGFFRNFTNAPVADTWYAATLANALAGSKLNTGSSDIYIAYSNIFNWYYGTDGLTPPTQMDFVSVVAHEIAHGLGFAGSMTVASGSGSWGSGTAYLFAYDRLAFVGSSQGLTNTSIYPNPSVALGTALTSNNVWFTGSNAKSANGGTNAKLYAPATWSPGSSYSHLDYSTFTGTANALMVYAISYGRAIHDPGTVTMGLLQDLGWTTASMPINGVCGSSNNGVFVPTNLCSSGTASTVSGSGPWTWTCNGSSGGTTASCSTGTSIASESFSTCTLPAGWSVTDNAGTGAIWSFNDPGGKTNKTVGTGCFAIADSDRAGTVSMDTELRSPTYDLSLYSSVSLGFKTYYLFYNVDISDVDVSNDGGSTWNKVWRKTGASYLGTESIDISALVAGKSNVRVRFHYYNANFDWYWQIDDFALTGVLAPKAKIGSVGYTSLTAAYSVAVSSDVIMMLGSELPDNGLNINVVFAPDKIITLKGGYNVDYSDRSGLPTTYLRGPLKISSGRLDVEGLTVRP